MALSAEDKQANGDRAVEQVAFDPSELNYPREDGAPVTALRRRSIDLKATLFQLADPTVGRESIDAAVELDNPTAIPVEEATLARYLEMLKQADGYRYTVSSDELFQDMFAKINHWARSCGQKGDPSVPFKPLTTSGKRAFENANGLMTLDSFKKLFAKDADALFQEVKLRFFHAIALNQQVIECHRTAKDIDACLGHLVDWAAHFGHQMTYHSSENDSLREAIEKISDGDLGRTVLELRNSLDKANARIADLEKTGRPDDAVYSTEDYDQLLGQLEDQQAQTSELGSKLTAAGSLLDRRNARIADLDERLRTLQENVRNHEVELERVRREAREASVSTATSNADKRSTKVPDPPIWTADKDSKITFEVWWRRIDNKLRVNSDHFADDLAMRVYIEGCIGGQAANNLDPYVRDDNPSHIASADELLKHLWNEYHDPNVAEKSLEEFESLRMEPNDDFHKFKNTFVRLAGECGKPRSEWKKEFKRRITTTLQMQLASAFVNPMIGFEEYARMGSEIDNTLRQATRRRTAAAPRATTAPTAPSNRATGTSRGGYQGTRGNGTFGPGRGAGGGTSGLPPGFKRPTPDEVKQLMKDNACFICRQPGHMGRNCPKNPKNQSPVTATISTIDSRVMAAVDYHFGKAAADDAPSDGQGIEPVPEN